ncbi:jg27107 [Pararge aegeria aegeria]|uniref:Jg27107 protein n=1 Tax=Pararge aegeria aegeria TaxID=348720 RepID=A0A8S4QXI4_9NEOP|nr:jg27107 [Pararge aegeria aegeria]
MLHGDRKNTLLTDASTLKSLELKLAAAQKLDIVYADLRANRQKIKCSRQSGLEYAGNRAPPIGIAFAKKFVCPSFRKTQCRVAIPNDVLRASPLHETESYVNVQLGRNLS